MGWCMPRIPQYRCPCPWIRGKCRSEGMRKPDNDPVPGFGGSKGSGWCKGSRDGLPRAWQPPGRAMERATGRTPGRPGATCDNQSCPLGSRWPLVLLVVGVGTELTVGWLAMSTWPSAQGNQGRMLLRWAITDVQDAHFDRAIQADASAGSFFPGTGRPRGRSRVKASEKSASNAAARRPALSDRSCADS